VVIAEGVVTGNATMVTTGKEALQENKAANIEGLGAVLSMGRGGVKSTPGGRFSPKTKALATERAKGKCEYCGVKTEPGKKSESGVTPPKNEGQTDHIDPKSNGGTNSPENAAHACRECNVNNSNTPKPSPRETDAK
jgi:hypothetical protein